MGLAVHGGVQQPVAGSLGSARSQGTGRAGPDLLGGIAALKEMWLCDFP
jgi:hypothetical protein